jgi:hypothetical protein
VYDLDTEQWMPPWSHSTHYIRQGEGAPGDYRLFSCDATNKVTQLTPTSTNNDLDASSNPVLYTPTLKTALTALVPDFGTRFSYAAAGFYDEPSKAGCPFYFQIDTDGSTLGDVKLMEDDDPLNPATTYTSIFGNQTTAGTAWNRNTGTRLVQNVFSTTRTVGRWVSWLVTGTASTNNFKIYSWFTGYMGK